MLHHLFVWLGCILDGAQCLPLVLQLVVELAEFGGRIARLLVDSFAAFVARLLPCVQTLTLSKWKNKNLRQYTPLLDWVECTSAVDYWCTSPPLFLQCYTGIGCAARLAWWVGRRGRRPGRRGSIALASSQPPTVRQMFGLIKECFEAVEEIDFCIVLHSHHWALYYYHTLSVSLVYVALICTPSLRESYYGNTKNWSAEPRWWLSFSRKHNFIAIFTQNQIISSLEF